MQTEVAIIGAGPAGIAAALQLKRSGREPLLLEREQVGGLLRNANLVENYPGFPQGVRGVELVRLFAEQLKSAGVEAHFEEVLRLDYDGKAFLIETNKREIIAGIVVLASGTKPKEFTDCEVPEEARARIFYEVFPLREAQEKRIAIVGAGDAAFDYALNLTQRNNKILILNRSSQVSCLPLLWERAKGSSHIDYQENTTIREISSTATGLLLKVTTAGKCWNFQADCAILAIGRIPRLDFLSLGLKERIEQLERAGVLYLIGDVRRGIYRQTAIAVGDGIEVAMKIYQRLKEVLR